MYEIFISYRHEAGHFAGRIYDFLAARGYSAFLDVATMHQGRFDQQIRRFVQESPNFLLVLSPGALDELDREDDWVAQEIGIALQDPDKQILLLADPEFRFPEQLPAAIEPVRSMHYYELRMDNFASQMERTIQELKQAKNRESLACKRHYRQMPGATMYSREKMEKQLLPLESRFGEELIRCVREGRPYDGPQRVQRIRMSCYAGSILFRPEQTLVDSRSFDKGLMYRLFIQLLADPDFSLEVLIVAPESPGAVDAGEYEKLGNSALEHAPEGVFYGSFAGVWGLIHNEPAYQKAFEEKRFRFFVTQASMSCSVFEMVYKPGWSEMDHVKVDFYNEGVMSNMDRRCMLFFADTDPENYNFFVQRYEYLRDPRRSAKLVRENRDKWLEEWETNRDYYCGHDT